MDLLLYFIQRDKLNIYDVSISYITKEYLDFINLMKKTDDPQKTCIEISKEIISEIKAMKGIDGVHIMALGWEYLIPKMI